MDIAEKQHSASVSIISEPLSSIGLLSSSNSEIWLSEKAKQLSCSVGVVAQAGKQDFIGKILSFDYSGSLAVKMFFFVSGLVVTNSLLAKHNIFQFAVARFFRIWPALIVTLMVTAFIIGPVFTALPMPQYFADGSVYGYFTKGVTLSFRETLPGVFMGLARTEINASLWTIPLELGAYLTLAGLYLIGVGRSRPVATMIFGAIVIDALTGGNWLYSWLPKTGEIIWLAPCFAFGAILALWKDRVRLDIFVVLGAWVLYYVFKKSAINFSVFYVALFLTILYLSGTRLLLKLKPPADISYGIYLWGWPVQQVMASLFPSQGVAFNQITSIIVAALMGFASWHLIEKHFIRIGTALSRKYGDAFAREGAMG